MIDLKLELVPTDLVPVGGQPPNLVLQPLHLRVPCGEASHQVRSALLSSHESTRNMIKIL